MDIVKKYFFALNILFAFLFSASVAECIIPQPYRIGGTVTVDGSQLTQASDSGYIFVVTEQDGNDYSPEALDTDGLNGSNWYIIDIPIYDASDQQGGANPGDTAVIHVYRNGEELTVTSPANGSLTVGQAGRTQGIHLIVESPYTPPTQYRLTASVSGGNGTVSPTSGTYNEGTRVTLTARPNTGYRVASWGGTDNDGSDSSTNTVTMNSNKTVTVMFSELGPVIERFEATPHTISQDESAALSWKITGASSADIDNRIGSVNMSNGSISVSPDETTIYTLTATNSGGTVSASVSVTVEESSSEANDNDHDGIPDSEDPDDDNDGLPDIWEEAYGMDPLDSTGVNGPNGDLDEDGWANYEEYENETSPVDSASVPSLSTIQIVETIPKDYSGINDEGRVPNDTPFSLRIEAFKGIDITNTSSIGFTVDDGGIVEYRRDLSDTRVVKVINLTEEPDANVGHLWVSYYRSEESRWLQDYPFGATITIRVYVVDREGFMLEQAFTFKVKTEAEYEIAQESADPLDTSTLDPEDPDLEGEYDAGIQVDRGDLTGAKIIYRSDEPLAPTFDFSKELPPLDVKGMEGVGRPLILKPHAVFSTPVKIFIPCSEYSDLSKLCIMLHNGEKWAAACGEHGEILPGGEGWMVPGSRVNHHNGGSSKIEIQVYHFSAVQAAIDKTTESLLDDAEDIVANVVDEIEEAATGGSSGGCFIGTATPSLNMRKGTSVLFLICALATVSYTMTIRRRKNGYLRQLR